MHRLEALRREWLRARTGMAREKGYIEKRIPETEASIGFLEADLAQREQTGKEFSVTIGDVSYTEREAAGKALRQAAQMHREAAVIGAYRGLNLVGQTRHAMGQLGLEPEQVIGLALSNGDILEANSEVTDKGLFASLDAVLRSLDKKLEQARQSLVRLQADLLSLEGEIGKAWEHDEAYEKAAAELAAINAELDRWSRQQSERKDGENEDIDLSVVDNDDGWLEVFEAALSRIDEMHHEMVQVDIPEDAPLAVTPAVIAQVRAEVSRQQAQLDFMQAVASSSGLSITPESADVFQMSMFSDPTPAIKEQGGKRKK